MTIDRPALTPSASYHERQHERRPLRTSALAFLPGDRSFEVRTLDLSAGGLAILAPANPPPGTRFVIGLTARTAAKETVSIRTEVQVVHSIFSGSEGGFKIGLRFVALDSATAGAVLKLLA